MKTETKQAIKNGTAKAASLLLGDAHLIFQSLADGCINLEGKIVNKLTGEDYNKVRADRWDKTRETQQKVKDLVNIFDVKFGYDEQQDIMDNVTGM